VSGLELKVPPDVVWLVAAALMWLASALTPRVALPLPLRIGAAVLFAVLALGTIIAARVTLDRAQTTWHPTSPERTSSLVTTSAYRLSRNPMYLGMLLGLVGWAVLLASPLALIVCGGFALYVDRFQIRPEERMLSTLFGHEYREYAMHVRRWL
jgi:protein-S-isoprenylcysteine O-methyltransferase Ste14